MLAVLPFRGKGRCGRREGPEAANQVVQASGLTVSDAVRVLMTRIAHDKAIPAALFQPNAEALRAFAEAERGDMVRFAAVDALFDDRHADD